MNKMQITVVGKEKD